MNFYKDRRKYTSVRSNLAKVLLTILSPLAAVNAFVSHVCLTGMSQTAAGEQCAMQSCVGTLQWAGVCPHQKCPFPWENDPNLIQGSLGPHKSVPKRPLDWCSRFFTAHPSAQHTQTSHVMCDICSSRPHLCTACRQCSLKAYTCTYLKLYRIICYMLNI